MNEAPSPPPTAPPVSPPIMPPIMPPVAPLATADKPPTAKPGFLIIAAGILFLIVEYTLKGIWAFIRFFLPRWMK